MNDLSVVCPLCKSRIISLYYRKNRFLPVESFSPAVSDFGVFSDLFRCEACRAVFAAEVASPEELLKSYQSSDHGKYLLEEKNRRRNFQGLIKAIAKYVAASQPVRLLDVGASTGLFLDTVRQKFPHWVLMGIEASSSAVAAGERRYGLKLHQGMFEASELEPCSRDCVTMLDFIEHVRTPLEVIISANRCLQPGGILVITTPNIQSWTSLLFRQRWWGFRFMHTLYFSPLSMRQMLARGGFRVVEMRGLIRFFSIGYCLRHLGWIGGRPAINIPFPLSLGDMMVIARKEAQA